jgi:hypothetical protein
MATPVITAAKYQQLEGHGYAGPATALEPETVADFSNSHADWLGNYWFMHAVDGVGTVLSPVNIAPNDAEDAGASCGSALSGRGV